jgi:putative acetyltransferase
MHEITVRHETTEDARAIDVVHISAFGGEAEARLISALRASASYNRELSLVAELNGRIVGHVLLTRVPMRKDGEEKIVLALGPMSVVPSQSHRGIGSELIKASVELAREKGYVEGNLAGGGHVEYPEPFLELY